jgi:hypothetical protein
MNLQDHLLAVIARARAFYAASAAGRSGQFLVRAKFPAPGPAVPPLNSFDLDRQLSDWLDVNLAADRPRWIAREGLDDDSLPAVCPWFGIAEHSAWLGAEAILQEDTSLPIPILREPADLDRLSLRDDTRWFRYMKLGYDHLRSRMDGTFFLAVRGTMMPMDLANAVRGDEFFLDVLTQPEFAHRLMRFLVGAIRWYYSHLLAWAGEVEGGHVFLFGNCWVPDPCLGHVSNDAAMLCSPAVYREFGLPYERELAAGFDRVLYHVHNEKMHFVADASTLPGLAMLQVSHDPRTTPPFEDAARVLRLTGNAPLNLSARSEQLRAHITDFAWRNVFFDVSCRDRSDAEDIVRFVRDRSA